MSIIELMRISEEVFSESLSCLTFYKIPRKINATYHARAKKVSDGSRDLAQNIAFRRKFDNL